VSDSALILQRKEWEGNSKIRNRTVDILNLNGIKWQPIKRKERYKQEGGEKEEECFLIHERREGR